MDENQKAPLDSASKNPHCGGPPGRHERKKLAVRTKGRDRASDTARSAVTTSTRRRHREFDNESKPRRPRKNEMQMIGPRRYGRGCQGPSGVRRTGAASTASRQRGLEPRQDLCPHARRTRLAHRRALAKSGRPPFLSARQQGIPCGEERFQLRLVYRKTVRGERTSDISPYCARVTGRGVSAAPGLQTTTA